MTEISGRSVEIHEIRRELEIIGDECLELTSHRTSLRTECATLQRGRSEISERLSGPVVDTGTRVAIEGAFDTNLRRLQNDMETTEAALSSHVAAIDQAIEVLDLQLARDRELLEHSTNIPEGANVMLRVFDSISDLTVHRDFAISLKASIHPFAGGDVATYPEAATELSRAPWRERGIVTVEVADLPSQVEITSRDFRKVSEAEMRQGLERLQEMLPAISSGEAANVDYWRGRDTALGLTYADGYQRVYEAFYGMNAIRVEKVGHSYNVVNGRHRLHLASKMGIKSLPMSVTERVPTGG